MGSQEREKGDGLLINLAQSKRERRHGGVPAGKNLLNMSACDEQESRRTGNHPEENTNNKGKTRGELQAPARPGHPSHHAKKVGMESAMFRNLKQEGKDRESCMEDQPRAFVPREGEGDGTSQTDRMKYRNDRGSRGGIRRKERGEEKRDGGERESFKNAQKRLHSKTGGQGNRGKKSARRKQYLVPNVINR